LWSLRFSRAAIAGVKTAGSTLVEQKGIFLPESKGDVIFLPDIIIDDDKQKTMK